MSGEEEQGLRQIERATPLWAGIIISFTAALCLFIGYILNSILSYVLGIVFTYVVVSGVLARRSKRYEELIWKNNTIRATIAVVGMAAFAVYYAFVDVNVLFVFVGLSIVSVLLTQYLKRRLA